MQKITKILVITATYFELEKIIRKLQIAGWRECDKNILRKKSIELCFFF